MKRRRGPVVASSLDSDNATKDSSPSPKLKDASPPLCKIFALCLVMRMANSLLVQTYFNPDEHWQALEVAHRIAFGYGHLTWEWKKGIRSYLHPMLFVGLYKVLAFLHLDSPWFMIRAPRLLQSVFSAIGDLYLYRLSHVIFGGNVASWALFAQLSNWFMFFCINRTFSNSLETVLTLVSLYYWPCLRPSSNPDPSGCRKIALMAAALACALRPTSAITWFYIGLIELFTTQKKLKFALLDVVPIGTFVLGFTLLLDRQLYGSWVIVPLNFLKFNFMSSGGDYYGTHPWHWYMTQGFTVMLFTYIPFSIAGIVMSNERKLPGLILWVLGVYSLLGHKEFRYLVYISFVSSSYYSPTADTLPFNTHHLQISKIRFVLPVLPTALMFSGYSLDKLGRGKSSKRIANGRSSSHKKPSRMLHAAVLFLLVTNIPMAIYMSTIHQRGAEDVMNYFSEAVQDPENEVNRILFLTPCHATPYYSTLHQNIPMRFLDCTPSEEKGMMDESDQFLADPFGFATNMARNWTRPSHIVLFESQEKLLKDFLLSHNFFEVKRFFHAHFKVNRELQASMVVYAFRGS